MAIGREIRSLVGNGHTQGVELSYRRFIFSKGDRPDGVVPGLYEGAFRAFVRMYYPQIFQAIAIAPITLTGVLWGELPWDPTKGTAAAEVVAFISVLTADFPPASVNALVRALTVGLPFQFQSIAILSVWLVALVAVAQRSTFRPQAH